MTEFISTCSMPLAIVFLIAGFFLLVKGADVFVEGSSSIAKRFHVPAIIIGLTIVATSGDCGFRCCSNPA